MNTGNLAVMSIELYELLTDKYILYKGLFLCIEILKVVTKRN